VISKSDAKDVRLLVLTYHNNPNKKACLKGGKTVEIENKKYLEKAPSLVEQERNFAK
jgi:hypothetical protein